MGIFIIPLFQESPKCKDVFSTVAVLSYHIGEYAAHQTTTETPTIPLRGQDSDAVWSCLFHSPSPGLSALQRVLVWLRDTWCMVSLWCALLENALHSFSMHMCLLLSVQAMCDVLKSCNAECVKPVLRCLTYLLNWQPLPSMLYRFEVVVSIHIYRHKSQHRAVQ